LTPIALIFGQNQWNNTQLHLALSVKMGGVFSGVGVLSRSYGTVFTNTTATHAIT